MTVTFSIPELETERLRLRAPTAADFEHEAAFMATPRSVGVGGPMSRAQTWRSFATTVGHWVLRGYGFWAVEEKATGAYCGHVGLWYPEDWPEPEVGWTLMGHAEGRGIAHEAALASRAYAYGTLGWTTAISLILPDNARSKALAARLGATLDSTFEHERFGPVEIWRHPGPEALA